MRGGIVPLWLLALACKEPDGVGDEPVDTDGLEEADPVGSLDFEEVDLLGGRGVVGTAIAIDGREIAIGASLRDVGGRPGALLQWYSSGFEPLDGGSAVAIEPIEALPMEMAGAYALVVDRVYAYHHFTIDVGTPLGYVLETRSGERDFYRYLEAFGELTSQDAELVGMDVSSVACGPGLPLIRWTRYTTGSYGQTSPWPEDYEVHAEPAACAVRGDLVLVGGAEETAAYRIVEDSARRQPELWEPGAIAIDGSADAWMVVRTGSIEVRQDGAEAWTVPLEVEIADAKLATGAGSVFVAVIGSDGSAWMVTASGGGEPRVHALRTGLASVTALDVEVADDLLVVSATNGDRLRAGSAPLASAR